jgi:hypothetical protein
LNPLDDTQARADLVRAQAFFRQQAGSLVEAWGRGELTAADWQGRMETELRSLHAIAALLATGGAHALTAPIQRLVRDATEAQINTLHRWMQSSALPTPRVSEAMLRARAQLYAGAATTTYARVRIAALGLPTLPVYPGEASACAMNCLCFWSLTPLDGAGNFDMFWHRTAEESCPQCQMRERVFNPLRIRNGLVMPYDSRGVLL